MGNAIQRVVFQPPPPSYKDQDSLIWLSTRLGSSIPAYFIDRKAQLTILFSHGNAEDIGSISKYFREVSAYWKVNVMCYEYSGYGLSSGNPSEGNVYADIEAAYHYLIRDKKVPWHDIVLYGRSLGSGASIHLAYKHPVRGVILQSGILSVHRVALTLRHTLPGDMFCNIDKIGKVHCPVFVIHGTEDEIVPLHHGKELYNAAPTRATPLWVDGAGHNDVEVTGDVAFFEGIARFLEYLASQPAWNYVDDASATARVLRSKSRKSRFEVSTTRSLSPRIFRTSSGDSWTLPSRQISEKISHRAPLDEHVRGRQTESSSTARVPELQTSSALSPPPPLVWAQHKLDRQKRTDSLSPPSRVTCISSHMKSSPKRFPTKGWENSSVVVVETSPVPWVIHSFSKPMLAIGDKAQVGASEFANNTNRPGIKIGPIISLLANDATSLAYSRHATHVITQPPGKPRVRALVKKSRRKK